MSDQQIPPKDPIKDTINKITDIYNKGVIYVKAHPIGNIFIGIIIGCILSVIGFGYIYVDSQRQSTEIIRQLRQSKQSADTELGQITNSIGRLVDRVESIKTTSNSIKDNAQRSSIIIDGLRKIVNLLPDGK